MSNISLSETDKNAEWQSDKASDFTYGKKVPTEEAGSLSDLMTKRLHSSGLLPQALAQNNGGVGQKPAPIQKEETEEGIDIVTASDTTVIEEDNNYRDELCGKLCVLRDVVGCDNCGIFHYAFKRDLIKVKVERR